MNTKTLTPRSLSVIDQYLNFKIGGAVCSVPYFNNKTANARGALRAYIGKGSPKDIFEEIQAITIKNRISLDSLSERTLKELLVENKIGIDCSGFAYYVLNAESQEIGRGTLDKHISFINCHGLIGKIRCVLRPVENCDVATLASDQNSKIIKILEIKPGDMITMIGSQIFEECDHILIIHQVEYQNFIPIKIHYSHAIAYPEDGLYDTGIRQGVIEITNLEKSILECHWIEDGKEGDANQIFKRAQKSKTEIRRLRRF